MPGDGVLDVAEVTSAQFPMGWNWYILNFYVPMIVVGHVMIIRYLLRRGGPPPVRVTAT